ncbi:hypothetical protein GCM10008985_03570 [Halococcus dombrowskii]|uniref:Uncharacterized protein n=1 Tax=Halococcus dombrowskii TaxID=179637 RepID=A0AAV3SC85_HALDO
MVEYRQQCAEGAERRVFQLLTFVLAVRADGIDVLGDLPGPGGIVAIGHHPIQVVEFLFDCSGERLKELRGLSGADADIDVVLRVAAELHRVVHVVAESPEVRELL